MEINIVKNAKRNMLFGIINKSIVMFCPFIERTIIQYVLGSQYLGLNSLFSSILSVLSLSELGLSAAIVYNMYKPVADGEVEEVNALLNFYKKSYKYIGAIISIVGLLITPFITHLIKGSYPSEINIYIVYLIFFFNTVISYFLFSYLNSIIVVHQRDDINSIINSCVKLGLAVAQITILLTTKNYYIFVFLMPLFTIINNLWVAFVVNRKFPQYKPRGLIGSEKIKSLKKLVLGSFIQKACVVSRNSLDSICISAILGLTVTAIYNNYYMILAAITSSLTIFSNSIIGGIGNHVARKSVNENYQELSNIDFAYLWISGWCAICLACLYQPFVKIWMGEHMLLPTPAVLLLCLYFYILTLGDMRLMYTSASGLWWEHRYRSITETIGNLILNICLGKLFGVYGIITATIITMFVCNYLWGASITFKCYFNASYLKQYFIYQAKYSCVTFAIGTITLFVCGIVPFRDNIIGLICRVFVCIILPNCLYFIIYRNNSHFKYFRNKLLKQ